MRDDPVVDAILKDPWAAPVGERMQAMARYARKLTVTPRAMAEDDVKALRDAGLSDLEIADVNWICGYFNMMNRLALGLGIATESGASSLPVQ